MAEEVKTEETKAEEAKVVGSQLGKRYRCQTCGTEILCIKAGQGVVTCCEQEVQLQEPKAIPSSDQELEKVNNKAYN